MAAAFVAMKVLVVVVAIATDVGNALLSILYATDVGVHY